jgi:TM2 domain-containing membrane protein YozV
MVEKTKFCQHCGEKISVEAEICPKCGIRVKDPSQLTYERKNPGFAVILSFFFTGLGQIYNGQIGKGLLFIVIGGILALTMVILIGFILYPLFWVYNLYDAYNAAKKINTGEIKV